MHLQWITERDSNPKSHQNKPYIEPGCRQRPIKMGEVMRFFKKASIAFVQSGRQMSEPVMATWIKFLFLFREALSEAVWILFWSRVLVLKLCSVDVSKFFEREK